MVVNTENKASMRNVSKEFAEKVKGLDEDFSTLIEAGFIAVKQLNGKAATNLFRAAQSLRPDHPFPFIGYGYIALNQMETDLAIKTFEEILKFHPDNLLSQMFLGISYAITKKADSIEKGEKMIEKALAKAGSDESLQHLGKTSLEWIKKDLKSSKGPL